MTEGALAQKKCAPCRGGVPSLNPDEVQSSLAQVTGWNAADGDTKIAGEFRFKNFRQTLDFVTAIGELAEPSFTTRFRSASVGAFAPSFCRPRKLRACTRTTSSWQRRSMKLLQA